MRNLEEIKSYYENMLYKCHPAEADELLDEYTNEWLKFKGEEFVE